MGELSRSRLPDRLLRGLLKSDDLRVDPIYQDLLSDLEYFLTHAHHGNPFAIQTTHSNFPMADPLRQYSFGPRRFIRVALDSLSPPLEGDQIESGLTSEGDTTHDAGQHFAERQYSTAMDENDGPPVFKSKDDLLDALATHLYDSAFFALNEVVGRGFPARQDFIFTGLAKTEVRELEQRFVRAVEEDFEWSDDVVVDPALYQTHFLPVENNESDSDNDAYPTIDHAYAFDTTEEAFRLANHPNHNLYEHLLALAPHKNAFRQYQKCVLMVDFFHATE